MKKALEKIINYAVYVTEPDMIILFGSLVGSKNNIYSDVDLLIVSDNVYMRKELEDRISSFAKECSLKADVLIHTTDELEKAMLEPFSFLGTILRSGKIVYNKK